MPAQGLHDPRDDNGGWGRRSLLRRSRGIPLRSPLLRLAPAHAVVPLSLSLSLVSSSSWCARARFASVCFWRRKILDFEIQEFNKRLALEKKKNISKNRSLRILIGSSPRLACCAGAAILLPGGRIIGRVVVGGFPGEVPRPSDPSPPHHHHRRRQPSGCDGESFLTIAQLDTVFLGYDFFS